MKPFTLSAVLAMAVLAGCSTSADTHAGSKLDTDLQYVAAQVAIVQQAETDYAKSPTQSNLDQLAQAAQQVHDEINRDKDSIGVDGNSNSDAIDAQVAAGDLKNAMGALVAITGNPGPATLASFTSQFSQAVGEWNTAVGRLYAKAKSSSEPPPTISCPSC